MSAPLRLEDAVTAVEGVGRRAADELKSSLQIETVRDLLEHVPRAYEEHGQLTDLLQARTGEKVTLIGRIGPWSQAGGRGRVKRTSARVTDRSGRIFEVTFFNQPWQAQRHPAGTVAAFSGELKRFNQALQMANPQIAAQSSLDVEAPTFSNDGLQPVYPATESVPTGRLAKYVHAAIRDLVPVVDHLGEELRAAHDLRDLHSTFTAIHQPRDRDEVAAARRRLTFDELFILQVGLQLRRHRLEVTSRGKPSPPVAAGLADRFLAALPFMPTKAQSKAFSEVGEDLAAARPMHRLLQGDVGAGKTLVAAWAMLQVVDAGRQAALMVPTEVLAEQHLRTLVDLLTPLGVNFLDGPRVELLTGSSTTSHRRRVLSELLVGTTNIVVGTHALLEEGVRFADLGLVVVDEQHRFGVEQRVTLKDKGADDGDEDALPVLPDVLVMTATPIPRSLALTLYGDLDVTVLDELPAGRQPIVTQLITPDQAGRREKLEQFIEDEALAGRQTYVVCPLVEPSDELEGVRSAVEEHERLTARYPTLQVGLVHGRLRPADKEAAMQAFRDGETHILVSTTVIEVGVDVPNATIMVIEDANRFGISQLHQLRGRVGRGSARSYCVLFTDLTPAASEGGGNGLERLEAVAATTDGFRLADVDLELRGEGALFGQRQSGIADLRFASVIRDLEMIGETRQAATAIVGVDPTLITHPRLLAEVRRRFPGGAEEFAALETG